MSESLYQFEALIEPVPDKGGAFVRVPFDIRKEFGQGRVKVEPPSTVFPTAAAS